MESQLNHEKVKRMEIGQEVEARHEAIVAARRAAVDAIEQEREPLRREYERHQAQRQERTKLTLSLTALVLSLLGNLLQWLRWL